MKALAVVVALLLLAVAGCGGPPREARVALEQTAGGVNLVDDLLEDEVEEVGDELKAEVRRLVNAGELEACAEPLAPEMRDACVTAGLSRFDELLAAHWTTGARRVNAALAKSLRAAELALDAWAAGVDDASGFLEAAACVVGSILEVVRALEAGGVDVPSELTGAVDSFGSLVIGICPEESEAE